MDLKLDVLALAAHPDDVEISCSGTLISMVAQGKKVGIADFTRGELGTRGTAETRKEEAKVASEIMGIHWRTNLDLGDGFFEVDQEAIMAVIHALRTTQPDLLLINAPKDRHPDHGRAAELSQRAAFLSGLAKIKTPGLDPWRPKQILHYIQDLPLEPDVVVDISAWKPYWPIKLNSSTQNLPNPKRPFLANLFWMLLVTAACKLGDTSGSNTGKDSSKPVQWG